MSEADEEEDEEEADDEEDPPPLPFSLRLWSTATIRAAKEVFKEHFTKTIVGDCDFGYPYKGEVDSRGKLTTLGKLNKELEELIKQKKRSDPYKDHPFYKEEREWLTKEIKEKKSGLKEAGIKAMCGDRDMLNGCTMADMFMGKHNAQVDCRPVPTASFQQRSAVASILTVSDPDDTDPQTYKEIYAKLGQKLESKVGRLTKGGLKDDSALDTGSHFTTLLKDNPLFEIGVEPLYYAEHSAKTTGWLLPPDWETGTDPSSGRTYYYNTKTNGGSTWRPPRPPRGAPGRPGRPVEYGVSVCWTFAASGMNALITKIKDLGAIATGSRIWWLREKYASDGHEYLAITRPGVATTYSTAKELFDDDDTIVVDYWCAPPSFLEPLFAPATMGPSPLTRAALQVLGDGVHGGS